MEDFDLGLPRTRGFTGVVIISPIQFDVSFRARGFTSCVVYLGLAA